MESRGSALVGQCRVGTRPSFLGRTAGVGRHRPARRCSVAPALGGPVSGHARSPSPASTGGCSTG